ncbi:hypothetical protein KHA93_05930 [Bacillus sp. FJAT-49732]|uniref:Uncharacterized protein n=1 Tax=Lederbergia citrisecunda TaxID=2833583 RepID=A0A942TKL8_9BACI|nr:hypothetical protein [Lederbergia citrisecunda]MBS4199193.1 hypothetical protein [Lederbergia citrisecunda]
MRRRVILIIGISILAIPIFLICNFMNPKPGQTSGNGNPAILLLGIIFIMFCCLVYLWTKVFSDYTIKTGVLLVGITVTFIHLVMSIFYQRIAFLRYKNILAEKYKVDFGFIDGQYIDSITSFMSIHVNKQYFNVNTYFIFLTASIFLSLLLDYFRKSL